MELRNVAIIAHVDHGKTTLVDGMLRQGNVFRANQTFAVRVMDNMDQERERGITIVAKNTAILYPPENRPDHPVKINIVDTPGHADFGGEVERVMGMVDGVLLLVDSVDGPMPQTRFVLQKALQAGHKAVVVINKIDRADARLDYALDQTFDLFCRLGANEDQLDFQVVYTNALAGTATMDPEVPGTSLRPLFETIVHHLPAPVVAAHEPFAMLVSTIDYDDYRGRIAIGKIYAGSVKPNTPVVYLDNAGNSKSGKITSLFVFEGLKRTEVQEAHAGEIIAITGIADVNIGETVADKDQPVQIPSADVDEPTLQMTFAVNTSPLAGREGTWCTSRKLRERLLKELETNVSLRVEETDSPDSFLISGRGELHLAVLIETIRREGYELQVSQPMVIYREINGVMSEPVELVRADVSEEYMGTVIEQLSMRKGEMLDMTNHGNGSVEITYRVPTRGLLGFRSDFITLTRGTGVLNTLFDGYRPMSGELSVERSGSLLASESGMTTAFGLSNAEARGVLFVGAGTEVYAGMIVGKHSRESDLEVNVCKMKHLTNMRSSTSDVGVRLMTPVQMSLDRCIEYIGPDELVEVTPKSIRMRKRILDTNLRRREEKKADARTA